MSDRKMHPNSLANLEGHGFRPSYDERRNPGGRPRDPMTSALRERANELVPDGSGETYAEAAARALFDSALQGSHAAYSEITDRLEGKPPQQIGMRVNSSNWMLGACIGHVAEWVPKNWTRKSIGCEQFAGSNAVSTPTPSPTRSAFARPRRCL